MQKHIGNLIPLLKLNRFHSSSGLSHWSDIIGFEKEHSSLLSKYSDIISVIDWQNSTDFFSWLKSHNRSREFFEAQNEFFFGLFDTILIREEYEVVILKMQGLGKNDLSFESELLFEIDRRFRHISCTKIFEPLHNKLSNIRNHDEFVLVVSIDEIKGFLRDILNSRLIQHSE